MLVSILFWGMSCVLVNHLHLTSIIVFTSVWAQACVLEHKTPFAIIVHLWSIGIRDSSLSTLVCVGWSSFTVLPLLVQIVLRP